MNFKEWFEKIVVIEAFGQEEIEAHKPMDGKWHPPLDQENQDHNLFFNAPSDPHKDCNGKPCYRLMVNCDYSGGADDGVNIGFKHAVSYYNDRFDADATADEKALQQKIGKEVMMSVLYGVGEYIKKWRPMKLRWGAIEKSRLGATNSDARKKVYKLWAKKNLFPKYYIPIDDQEWVRRDAYEKHYVSAGFPTIPGNIDSIGQKGKLVDELIEFANTHGNMFRDARRAFNQQMEEDSQRRIDERDREQIDLLNQNHYVIGDHVVVRIGVREGDVGTITRLYMYNNYLMVTVKTDDGWENAFRYGDVERADEHSREESARRNEEFVRANNPEGLKPGDKVICLGEHGANYEEAELLRLQKGEVDHHTGLRSLVAVISTFGGYEYTMSIYSVKKDTPDNREKAELAKEFQRVDHELNGLERTNHTCEMSRTEHESQPEYQQILNDRTYNPSRLKLGDIVGYQSYGSERRGAIVDFTWYGNNLAGVLYCTVLNYEGNHMTITRQTDKLRYIAHLHPHLDELREKHAVIKRKLAGWLHETS